MSLIKARPAISLLLPAHALAGDRVTAQVRLDLRKPLEVEAVTCSLRGVERVGVGGGSSRRTAKKALLSLGAQLCGKRLLPAGRVELSCTFELPADLPPSYQARSGSATVQVEYLVTVDCAIPWWPDKRQDYVMHVRRPATDVAGAEPSVHTTNTKGPRGNEAHVEFSLSSRSLAPGAVLEGQLALANVEHNRYRTAVLSLVGSGTLRSASGRQLGHVELHRYSLKVDLTHAEEGQAVPFGMKLPDTLPPSYSSALWELRWAFDLELDIAWSKNLTARVPVEVLPTGSASRRTRKAAPTIGSERISSIWQQAAASHGLLFDAEEQRIEGTRGDVGLVVSRSHRGSQGIFLVAELTYPSLGLDLDGGHKGGLRRMLGGGVRVGVDGWDRHHYLTGREEAQVAGFVAPLASLLVLHDLVDIHDQAMSLEVRDAGQSPKILTDLIATAVAIAVALPHARDATPAPACMRAGIESWERVARRLGGQLARGPMLVRGQLDGQPVRLGTGWSPRGEATHTEVWRQAPALVREGDELSWEGGHWSRGDPARCAEPVRAQLARVLEAASSLIVTREDITLQDSRAPILEEGLLWGRIAELSSLAAALGRGGGPYR